MTSPTVEQAARDAADRLDLQWNRALPQSVRRHYKSGVRDGFKSGHASRDAEIAAKDEELAAMQAKLVQQAHDYRAQVVFWGENADERSTKIAALRAKLAEAEAKAAKWVTDDEKARLMPLGYVFGPEMVWHRGPGMIEAQWHWLMVPPVPLPEPDK